MAAKKPKAKKPKTKETPEAVAPVAAAPEESAAPPAMPAETPVEETQPVESAAVESAPMESAAVEPTPVEPAPVEPEPAPEAPAESATEEPVEPAPVEPPAPVAPPSREQRIRAALGSEGDAQVSPETVARYLSYLQGKLPLPCPVRAAAPFDWEKLYAWGLRDQGQYGQLKQARPSFSDSFELIALESEADAIDGALAQVRRTTDQKDFIVPLAALRATDGDSPAAELLEDYADWFEQYR